MWLGYCDNTIMTSKQIVEANWMHRMRKQEDYGETVQIETSAGPARISEKEYTRQLRDFEDRLYEQGENEQ